MLAAVTTPAAQSLASLVVDVVVGFASARLPLGMGFFSDPFAADAAAAKGGSKA